MMDRDEIAKEVNHLHQGSEYKIGLLEHLMAYMLHANHHVVDVHCPDCKALLVVVPFPANNGYSVTCSCGRCSGAFRGL